MNWFQRHLNYTVLLSWNAFYPIFTMFLFIFGFVLEPYLEIPDSFAYVLVGLLVVTFGLALPLLVSGWALRRKNRRLWWLLMIFVPMVGGIVLLCLENRSKNKVTSAADIEGTKPRHNGEGVKKICPHCGHLLHNTAFKCDQCKKWVPNELFERLCDEDVTLIKDKDLTPITPSLMVTMLPGPLENGNTDKQLLEMLGRKHTKNEQFKFLVFQSFCFYGPIRSFAHMKRGLGASDLSCRQTIEKQLKIALLNRIIPLASWSTSESANKKSAGMLRAEGEALYDDFDDIWEHMGTSTASQTRVTVALASAVFGENKADILTGLPLYTELLETSINLSKVYGEVFLVEEKDFDWQTIVGELIL
jgi:hypothetical protein